MSSPKAGLNKVVLLQITQESESKIIVQEHLKEKKFKIVDIGSPRTTFDNAPTFDKGDTVHITPMSGHVVKEGGKEYVVCGYEEILLIC